MRLTFGYKLAFAFCTLLIWCFSSFVSLIFSTYSDDETVINENNCVYDPLLTALHPASMYILGTDSLRILITGVLAIGLDGCILSLAVNFVAFKKTATIIPTMLIFHMMRAISLNIVVFPGPINFAFVDPGFPSLTAAYDRTNDLYVSGHIGTATLVTMDNYFNKNYKLAFIFLLFWGYTLFSLAILGVHYLNDIIYGFLIAVVVTRLVRWYRYYFTLFFLNVHCQVSRLLEYVFECHCFRKAAPQKLQTYEDMSSFVDSGAQRRMTSMGSFPELDERVQG